MQGKFQKSTTKRDSVNGSPFPDTLFTPDGLRFYLDGQLLFAALTPHAAKVTLRARFGLIYQSIFYSGDAPEHLRYKPFHYLD